MKKEKMFYISLAVCTALFTSGAVFGGIYLKSSLDAKSVISNETETLEAENENLRNREEILEKSVSSKEDETDEKDELNKKIIDITKQIETLNSDIESKKEDYSKLEETSNTLSGKLNTLITGMKEKTTSTKSVKDEVLMCPSDIPEGRYRISGDASFSITSVGNTVRTAEDLTTLDTGTYIFEIEAGEKIKTDGDAVIDTIAQ